MLTCSTVATAGTRSTIAATTSADCVLIHGYLPSEARLARDGETLIVRFAGSDDEIRILNTLNEDWVRGVNRIAFDDGSIWTMADVRARLISEAATAGNDVIVGLNYDETLAGSLGDDTLTGGYGSDAYVFNRGDGRDVIDDIGNRSDTDRIMIHGYQPSEANLRAISNILILLFAGTGDEIRVVNGLMTRSGYIRSNRSSSTRARSGRWPGC